MIYIYICLCVCQMRGSTCVRKKAPAVLSKLRGQEEGIIVKNYISQWGREHCILLHSKKIEEFIYIYIRNIYDILYKVLSKSKS